MGVLEGSNDGEPSGSGEGDSGDGASRGRSRNRAGRSALAIAAGAVALGTALWPLFAWQGENQAKALSLSNMRRVANGLLYYSEDWDQRMPPPVQTMPNGPMQSWPQLVRQYVLLDEAFSNPSNPLKPFQVPALFKDPIDGHAIQTSYALNRRFWSVFAPGAFPAGNLEIPEQTALLVEAGRMAADPRHPRLTALQHGGFALDVYGDTTDRVHGMSPYPAMHGGELGVVAADGHAIMARPPHYIPEDGPHDRLLGRMAGNIYNWNGGFPNGETDIPPRE